nr:MAG TPA: hypothetical protein [Caudoviricetes sp.]
MPRILIQSNIIAKMRGKVKRKYKARCAAFFDFLRESY